MDAYFIVKTLHILSATLLFGTGLGTAFHMWLAWRSGNVTVIARAAEQTVLADWLFTLPSGIFQLASGLWLVHLTGSDFSEGWLHASLALYLVALACWLPVVWLQIRVRDIVCRALLAGDPLPPLAARLMRWWFWLGWPAFIGLIAVFYLMVSRPG